MPLNNSLWQIVLFHKLAISTRPPSTFYFQRQLGVLIAWGSHLLQTHLHWYAPQMVLKNLRTITSMLMTTSLLKSWTLSIVRFSIQMIPPLKIKWIVWPMPKRPLWTSYRCWPILGMTSCAWLKLGFDIPLSIQFSLGLVSSLLGTTNAPKNPFLNL